MHNWKKISSKPQKLKTKLEKEYLRKTKTLLETQLSNRNLTHGQEDIDPWPVSLEKYYGPFIDWTKELRQL